MNSVGLENFLKLLFKKRPRFTGLFFFLSETRLSSISFNDLLVTGCATIKMVLFALIDPLSTTFRVNYAQFS